MSKKTKKFNQNSLKRTRRIIRKKRKKLIKNLQCVQNSCMSTETKRQCHLISLERTGWKLDWKYAFCFQYLKNKTETSFVFPGTPTNACDLHVDLHLQNIRWERFCILVPKMLKHGQGDLENSTVSVVKKASSKNSLKNRVLD